ncbi:putative phosphatidate phosphatase [Leguminivora glycinivorella]|uniref:putative phosphatidate phosphatase n=1 Tax=Leguminivora glycinivorella TaxID=1035111 RepID=UPI00200E9571|nr:putative phosphatidate phosphatase [Leguminivora glycinivorella]XP_047997073.1 putative phosphatidate phosphatase [Leguminivora glycinivorella]XP_047997074.1 putative phosphatidate phosphatase [Leguminivora glycinivorella]XP_047997076.1 putative phosphatidate phosphatase [Leguminivora glycinivorella]XP_047997077.1 putative phosphatidate phosphatase [Leguminivora glycinivorella]XP_047997078.1 putative phosphatidate phosphatase [Leguminivora glycinivorella]XP_047997079.1 putative phosphatida
MAEDKLIWSIVLDFFILCCLASPLLYFQFWSKPELGGFFPDDQSLNLPYKQQTVPEVVLAPVGFLLVIATILIVEYVRDKKGWSVGEKFLCDHLIPGWVWISYITIGIFTYGAVVQQVTSEILKQIIGRLRPHFIDVCRPVYNVSDPANANGFIQVYSCTDPNDSRVKELSLSFPSAHASFAMYVAVFYMIYLQLKCKWRGSKLLRHAVQFLTFLAALYVGLSRVVEHFHHRDDVAVGFVIGAVAAILTVKFVLKPKKYMPGTWQETPQQNILPRPVLAR